MEGISSCRSLLLIGDDPSICALIQDNLSPQEFSSQCALSGKEALEFLAERPFDVIISDLNMPGISGLEVLEKVRKEYPHSAFLMATGEDDIGAGIQAMKKGADDYLVKPFRFDAVLASIGRAIEKKKQEEQLENYRRNFEAMVEQRTMEVRAAITRIELTYDQTLEDLGAALDSREIETVGHTRRVTRYCMQIAREIGVEPEGLRHIARGSCLHDIGNIAIPEAILLKAGDLTPEEKRIMQSHALNGYYLVCRIPFLAQAAEIVLAHHERYDGTGYPTGLAGEEIPLGSRIFAVADTLDAMTSDRPYRRALSFATARAEIEREAGLQFDAEVVRVFLSVAKEVWVNIRSKGTGQRVNI